MSVNSDFCEMLRRLSAEGARFMLVGAHAVVYHTEPRFTKDLDILVEPSPENAIRVYRALAVFGAPLGAVSAADFAKPDLVYQVGVPPNRIDVLTSITAVEFGPAWRRRKRGEFQGVPVSVLGRNDLLRNKRAVARPQDLLDADKIETWRMSAAKRRARASRQRQSPRRKR